MQKAVPIRATVDGGFINEVQMVSKIFLMNVMGPKINARLDLRHRPNVG
jgi:hypothetical protein